MDRRRFLKPSRPAVPEPFEVFPGQIVRDGPIDWRHRAPQHAAMATAAVVTNAASARAAEEKPLDTSAGLSIYQGTFDVRRVRHLLRRAGFSAPPATVKVFSAMSASQAVDALMEGVPDQGIHSDPAWIHDAPPRGDQVSSEAYHAWWGRNHERFFDIRDRFILRAAGASPTTTIGDAAIGFRDRLSLMWQSHFVTERDSYLLAPWTLRYWDILEQEGLGNVKRFVHRIGLTPAMLTYLNGIGNRKEAPNENYARELMELFTMGIMGPDGSPNYTQADITEIARALTGWGVDYFGTTDRPLQASLVDGWHDDGVKTIFGKTGTWGYDDVIRILFETRSREIAWWISSRIYREFVYDVPHPGVVSQMAFMLRGNGFELKPVIRALLTSAHFFDGAALGVKIRSPFEHHMSAYRELGYAPDAQFVTDVRHTMKLAGQVLYDPPDVAGWPGGRAWLDTNRLTARWLHADQLLAQPGVLREFAQTMPDPFNPHRLAADIADALLGVSLSGDEKSALTPILLNGIPDYEWNPLVDGAEVRIRHLVAYLLRLPEFQLA